MKANLKGSGGIKGLALRHGEKFAMLVFGLLALWFVYSSWGLPRLKPEFQASKLREEINLTNNAVIDSKWPDKANPELASEVRFYEPIAEKQNAVVNPKHYPVGPLDSPIIAPSLLRTDPPILNAIDVRAIGGSGPLAFKDEETLKEQARIGLLKEEEQRKKDEQRAEDEAEAGGPEGIGRGERGGRGGRGEGPEVAGEFDPEHPNRRLIEGLASPEGVPLMGGERIEQHYWATVVAKVPIREQLKLYQDAFQDARGGFDPARDFPRYIAYSVQRSEVQPGKPLVWTDVPVYDGQKKAILEKKPVASNVNESAIRKLAELAGLEWAGPTMEPVDSRWTDPILTLPLPPLVGRNFGADATHPDIPLAINAPPLEEEVAPVPTNEPDDQPVDPEDGMSVSAGDPSQPPPGGGFSGPARPAFPGAGGMQRGGMGGPEFGGPRGGFARGGMEGPGGGMGRGLGGPESGAPYGGGIASGQRTDLPRGVDYLLLRFFDFTVEPGKKYKYRVRLAVADPNYGIPAESGMLDPSVLDRQAKLAQAARAKGRPVPFHRVAEAFSEPSPTVGIPLGGLVLLAEVKPPTGKMHNDEPAVTLIAETFDIEGEENSVIHVAHEKELRRGAVVNFRDKMKYTGENDRWIDTKDSYVLNTGLTLLDVDGADKLVKDKTSPSRALMMDVAGQLFVRDELADAADVQYIRLIFNDDKRRAGRPEEPGGVFGPAGPRGAPGPRRPRFRSTIE